MRLRILVGTIGLLIGLALYGMAVMAVAIAFLPRHWLVEIIFYTAAGIVWVYPAARLTGWMQRAAPHRPPQFD